MPVAYIWTGRLVDSILGHSWEYVTEIAASNLMKSSFRVELNSTSRDRVVLGLATGGDRDASVR